MNRIKYALIASFTVLVLIVLGFTGVLNMLSFKKQFTDSLVNGYQVVAGESVRKIEYAVKYGKPIENFFGIEPILQENKKFSSEITNVQIIARNGDVLYNPDGRVSGVTLDADELKQLSFTARSETKQVTHLQTGEDHQVFLPIFDGEGNWIATYNLTFKDEAIQKQFSYFAEKILVMLGICGAGALFLLIVLILSVKVVTEEGDILKKRLLVMIIGVLSLAQLVFGVYNYNLFEQAYHTLSGQTVEITSGTVKNNIESLLRKGVNFSQMYNIDNYFANTVKSVPLIDRIELTEVSAPAQTGQSMISVDLPEDRAGKQFRLDVMISDSYIAKQLRNTIWDGGTVLVISFLFLVEITIFLILLLRSFVIRAAGVILNRARRNELFEGEMIRPLTFAFAFAVFLPLSFIPVVMKGKVHELFGLSEQVLLAVPITAEILFAFLATMIAGGQIDRYGWRKGFLFGAIAFAAGSVLSGMGLDYVFYLLGRMIVGLGYGFGLLSLRAYVQQTYPKDKQGGGFSAMFSGLYAGVNGGVIVGALLADRLSFSFVFFLAGGIIFLSILMALVYMENRSVEQMIHEALAHEKVSVWKNFLLQPGVAGFFLFIIVPVSIASMFLDYYFPLFAAAQGVAPGDVGRVFLMHGLLIVYLGPLLLRWTEKRFSVKWSVILSGAIVVSGLLIFAVTGTVEAAILAVIFLGISDSFGLVAQNNYLLRLPQTEQIGSSRALGYFDNFRKFGQMISPMIFGGLAFMGGLGVGIVGIVFVVFILVFVVIALRTNGWSANGER